MQVYNVGAFNKVFIGLVKAYVTVKTDTQKLQIDATQLCNMLVIALTLARQIDRAAVGDKGVINALVTIDPYTSAWSTTDNLYDSPVKHWTGKDFSLLGVAKGR